jgi:hypothetical protein
MRKSHCRFSNGKVDSRLTTSVRRLSNDDESKSSLSLSLSLSLPLSRVDEPSSRLSTDRMAMTVSETANASRLSTATLPIRTVRRVSKAVNGERAAASRPKSSPLFPPKNNSTSTRLPALAVLPVPAPSWRPPRHRNPHSRPQSPHHHHHHRRRRRRRRVSMHCRATFCSPTTTARPVRPDTLSPSAMRLRVVGDDCLLCCHSVKAWASSGGRSCDEPCGRESIAVHRRLCCSTARRLWRCDAHQRVHAAPPNVLVRLVCSVERRGACVSLCSFFSTDDFGHVCAM